MMIIAKKSVLIYGICGLLGSLLLTTANAVPQSCSIQCTSNTACSTSCWNGEFTISCGAYGTCNIPTPTPQPYPSNRCVTDVRAAVSLLGDWPGKVRRYRKPYSSDPGEHGTALSWFNYVDNKNRTACHVQGLLRLTTGNDSYDKFTCNNGKGFFAFGANVTGDRCRNSTYQSYGPLLQFYSPWKGRFHLMDFWLDNQTDTGGTPEVNWHPGGMQAIGTYIVVGSDDGPEDSYISILDGTSRFSYQPGFVNGFHNQHTRAEAVAVGRRDDGRYVIVAGAEQGERIAVFLSSSTNIATSSWSNVLVRDASDSDGYWWPGKYPSEKDSNFNNYAFIQQCDGKLFLAGLTNSNDFLGGVTDANDTSHIHLYEVSWSGDTPRFTKALSDRLVMDNPCDCFLCFDVCPNWAAGGTLFVDSDGLLGGYATEHWPDGGDLDILSWEPNSNPSCWSPF